MTSEQLAAIERLRELEKKATPGEWDVSGAIYINGVFDLFQNAHDSTFIETLRNDGMPLIEALQKALSEAQADARVFSGSYNALAVDFGRLKEENERLRAGIGRALEKLDNGSHGDAEDILEALHDA